MSFDFLFTLLLQVHRLVVNRDPKFTNFVEVIISVHSRESVFNSIMWCCNPFINLIEGFNSVILFEMWL